MELNEVNDRVVALAATTEALKTSVGVTGQKIDTVKTAVDDIKNLLAQKNIPAAASAPEQANANKANADRLHGLIEIFYGLAIASGLQFVATYIFAPDAAKGDYPIGSPMWYVMLWSVGIALLASLSDWFDSAQHHQEYKRPMLVIYDLGFTLALFFLYVGSYRFEVFLGAAVVYSLIAFSYFCFMARPTVWQYKLTGYILIIAACLWSIVTHGRFRADAPALIPEVLIPIGLITVLLLVTMRVRWRELRELVNPSK